MGRLAHPGKNAVNTVAMTWPSIRWRAGDFGWWVRIVMGGVGDAHVGSTFPDLHEVGLTLAGVHSALGASRFALIGVAHNASGLAMFSSSVVFMVTSATIPTVPGLKDGGFSAFLIIRCSRHAALPDLWKLGVGAVGWPVGGHDVWAGGTDTSICRVT